MLARFLLLMSLVLFSHAVVAASQGIVVSENKLASQIGADILRSGGNAVDAAVAVGYALAVLSPCCGNIGGGGFMLIHRADGMNIFLNFREKAPQKAAPAMYLDAQGTAHQTKAERGFLAVAVPGTVLGFDTALKKYGTMPRSDVMAPAIRLAQEGYIVTPYQAELFAKFADDFRKQPNVAAIFLKNDKPYQAGENLMQKELAQSLKLISDLGADAFYHGTIAAAIVTASDAHGGILTLADFANYTVQELEPVLCNYRGYEFVSAPPPSSGGVALCEMLNILENFPLNQIDYRSTQRSAYIIAAMRYGFLDRNKLGDPDFISNPVDKLLDKHYAKGISDKISAEVFSPVEATLTAATEQNQTTHYSVLDKQGNAVSVTYTLNGWFGAKVIAGDTGFFLNDEMDDFSAGNDVPNQFGLVQSDANKIEPGKRPLSSMAPTIVLKNGKLILITGSPGGPRIITSILLSTLNMIDYDMAPQTAVDMPRFHYQTEPNIIYSEPFALPLITRIELALKGYGVSIEAPWSAVEAISIGPNGDVQPGSDNRRPDGGAVYQ